jgi:MinD superfamily P-loop ATPase
MSPPLIRKVLDQAADDAINIIDSPPGTTCPVIASVRGSDFTILVTEPTPFGLHDLELALDMVGDLGVMSGVVINRAEAGDTTVQDFCDRRKVEIIAEIPDDRRIAEAYSRGEKIIESLPDLSVHFEHLWQTMLKWVAD